MMPGLLRVRISEAFAMAQMLQIERGMDPEDDVRFSVDGIFRVKPFDYVTQEDASE